MTLIDLSIHGGGRKSDGSFTPAAFQAASTAPQEWLRSASLTGGRFVGEVFAVERLEDIEAILAVVPEHFKVI